MVEPDEQVILARIRTLLALERNYLAEERTELAELRTGLALALGAPSTNAFIVYILTSIQLEIFTSIFLGALTILGIRMCLRSRSKLMKLSKRKILLKDREDAIIRSSKTTYDLLGNLMLDE